MAEPGTFEKILGEIGQALLPLREALASPEAFVGFLTKLGWRAEDIPAPLLDVGTGVETLYDELRAMLGDGGLNVGGSVGTDGGSVNISADSVQRTVHAVQQVIAGIRAIASAPAGAIPAPLLADGFATEFPRQLVEYLVVTYLRRYHPSVAFALKSLGVIKTFYAPPTGGRPAYVHAALDLADLPKVFSDPSLVLRNAFGWGEPDFDFGALASAVENLLSTVGVDIFVETQATAVALAVTGGTEDPFAPRPKAIKAVIFERVQPSGRVAAEIRLMPLPAVGPHKPGLALLPSFNGALDFRWPLGPDIAVTIRSDLEMQGGIGLKVRPGEDVDVIVGFADGDAPVGLKGSIDVRAEHGGADSPPTLILGSAESTRLQFRGVSGVGGVRLQSGSDVDVFAEFELRGLEFVLQAGDADGFIAKILPSGGFSFSTDLALGISHRNGVYFRGTSTLQISIPAHVQLGPIEIQGLVVSITPSGDGLPVSLGASFAANLGPLRAVVEEIGITADFRFTGDHDGNLGPVDLALKFKPPKGIGLSVDAGVVRGGGYLYIDADRGEYAGALELALADIVTIKAIGIITTKMPDGSKGFSLLIIMSVEFGTGIQLGFGFTLLAVGGLLGLNRTMNLQALVDGVRTGSVNSVMFPQDIVANAPKIISDLRTFFPAQEGTFLIGPMVKLGWGTPTLVSVSLGVIIEIPGNVAILGVLKVALPADDVAVIQLQVQFVGAIEFDKKRIWFFASLYDSRVVFLTLDGEMGLLVAWGDDANFVVSVGGFHPRFTPPPLPFPSPRRIELSLLDSPVSRMKVQGYFAVTSNTVQFGARVDVFFGLSAFNVSGHLAFDALFQFSPFYFIIEISASFGVTVFGIGLFSVGVRGSLEGPTPWHVKGHGSISLLFWDIDVEFETTWGDDRDTQLPPVKVLELLGTELNKAETWRAVLPEGSSLLVTLRQLPAEEAALILHPVGVLHVSQRAVPLELTLDKVGNAKPSDVNRLAVTVAGGGLARRDDAYEQFAPAQYKNFSDADRLSQPAFSPQKSGLDLSVAGDDTRTSGMVKRVVRYEEIIIDNNFKRFARRFSDFLGSLFGFFLAGNSASRLDMSQASKQRLQPFADKVTVADDTYTVAFQSDNRPFESATFTSAASAHDFLAQRVGGDPSLGDTLHVIPTFEAVSS
jgi:hypothetical protein